MDSRDWLLVVSVFASIFIPAVFTFLSGTQWRAAEERARARRLAEHKMKARLLRLNI